MLYEDVPIYEDESIDDLQCKGLKIIQKKKGFRFGLDAVILADFANIRKNDDVLDLGTGTGIIPILIAGKTEARKIIGLEIQEELVEMASRSVRLNRLESRVEILAGDLKKTRERFGHLKFDVVTANPPYMNKGGGFVSPSDAKAISRHEIMCTLEDVVKAASGMLMPGGRFAMVHRPERLADIICLMRSYSIEPKYLKPVYPSPGKNASLVLINGIFNGRPQLKMTEPLYIRDEKGDYSDEINRIYFHGNKQ